MTPLDPHLDLDALADLLAGEGTPAQVAHVEGCPACSAALADLDAALVPVAAELAALACSPLPAPPEDLQERLRRAVAGVVPEPVNPVSTGAGAAVHTGVDNPVDGAADVLPLAPRRRRSFPLGTVAASVAGLLVAGGLVASVVHGAGSGSSSDSAASGAAAAPAPQVRTLSTGTDYRGDPGVLQAALPGLLSAPGTPVPLSAAASGASASRADPLARLHDPGELAGCLSGLSDPGAPGVPLAVDYARFAGQPALLVVLPSARAGKVDVFAVGAGCRAGDDRTLYFARLDAPA